MIFIYIVVVKEKSSFFFLLLFSCIKKDSIDHMGFIPFRSILLENMTLKKQEVGPLRVSRPLESHGRN